MSKPMSKAARAALRRELLAALIDAKTSEPRPSNPGAFVIGWLIASCTERDSPERELLRTAYHEVGL